MRRRQFLIGAAAAGLEGLSAGQTGPLFAQGFDNQPTCLAPRQVAFVDDASARFDLTIGPLSVEIAPGRVIHAIGYNGQVPGPLIRVRENERVQIRVKNLSGFPNIVHWHGLQIPSVEDGAMEEGSPMIEPGGTYVYAFNARPAGTRWYHSHAMAGPDLNKALYGAEYGFFRIDPPNDPGAYDQEIFLALHHWEPSWVSLQDRIKGPPANNGLEIAYKSASINGKALGHGEPIRVKKGQRALLRILNASATMEVMLALPGHRFTILAMDGNPVPRPQTIEWMMIAPAERIDAVVEMDQPGVWVLGSLDDAERASGMGIVVEYADAKGEPVWLPHPMPRIWDYAPFADSRPAPEPDERIELIFQKILGGRGHYNTWTINGKAWPHADPIKLVEGKRYRLSMHNLAADMHPIHLHRHSFEVTNHLGRPMSGLVKDVVALFGRRSGEIDFVANNPGPSLFHCHMQDHQDFGFMTLFEYA